MSDKLSPSKYIQQLDALRALAVGLVIGSHWLPESTLFNYGAHVGVHLFFVLSGYLITGILISTRSQAENLESSKGQILKGFYARRSLRIFPLYYLALSITYLIGAPNIQHYFTWHFFYLSNFLVMLKGAWVGESSHFWSLAVEEQFYLFWPLVILFTPKRYLLHAILASILLSPVIKTVYSFFGSGDFWIHLFPASSFHTLGAGALMALFEKKSKYFWGKVCSRLCMAAPVGLIGYVGMQYTSQEGLSYDIFSDVFLTVALTGLLAATVRGFTGAVGKLLLWKPILFLGKISYSLYIFHNFVPDFMVKPLLQKFLSIEPGYYTTVLPISSILLVLMSSFIWYFFESKINRYKNRFPYLKTTIYKSVA